MVLKVIPYSGSETSLMPSKHVWTRGKVIMLE